VSRLRASTERERGCDARVSRNQHPNERQGTFAEEYVANSYGLEHAPGEADWYDAVHPERGTKYEVKSTHTGGRFRLWEGQVRSLVASDGQGTAWIAFVLLDANGNVVDVQRRKPSTVLQLVNDRGGFNRAGHQERDSRQHKLPEEEVM